MDNLELIKQYLPLCWFKKDPAALPRSIGFLKQNLLVCFVVEYFMQLNMIDDPFESFFEVLLQLLLALMFIGFVLLINKTLYTFIQVASAVFSCTNIVSILIVPVAIWLTVTNHPASYIIASILGIWGYAMIAYVFKKALVVNGFAGMILSTSYFLATYLAAFGIAQLI